MSDTLNDRIREEHEESLAKKKELIQAYNRDSLGSYDRAQKRAYDSALPDDFAGPASLSASVTPYSINGSQKTLNTDLGKRVDFQWVQKIRQIADVEFKNQQRKELDELQIKYNLNKPAEGPIGSFVDMPVRITDALGRDIGEKLGELKSSFAGGIVNPILGSGS